MTTKPYIFDSVKLLREHKKTPQGMVFYSELEEIRAERNLRPYLHLLERAWNSPELNLKSGGGVLCVEGLPTLYLITRKTRVSATKAEELHQHFWNQGVAKILVIADPVDVRIYSGMKKPDRDAPDGASGLVDTLELANYAFNLQTFYRQLATGAYFRSKSRDCFDPNATIDNSLLANLREIRNKLISDDNGLPIETAHTLLARVLFVCYLIDREIIDLGNYKFCRCKNGTKLAPMLEGLKNTNERQRTLNALFNQLKDDFNGSMFEHSSLKECQALRASDMHHLISFLNGDDVKSGQSSFDFWAYNFKWIPVETISAIYEDFLKGEDPKGKKKTGAFYTPRFLAEATIDALIHEKRNLRGKRFLDPSCGSGIFLVILFNRLASDWMVDHPNSSYQQRSNALQSILEHQLYGIDVNPTACRITCFSLYLAYLERFNPPDIKAHIERKGRLPNILQHKTLENPELDFPVIQEENFLEPEYDLPGEFDFVVGNPPWSSRGSIGLHQRFAEKIPSHLTRSGTSCLLLPSKMFLNDKTNRFQERWFQQIELIEVVQLADYRKILFKEAKCPCMMVLFKNQKPDIRTSMVEYVTPKVSHIDYREGVIPVAPQDRKEISLNQLLIAAKSNKAPILWKQNLWATPRDNKFLEMLHEMPRLSALAGFAKENKPWVVAQGFKPFYPEKAETDPSYPKGTELDWDLNDAFIRNDREFPPSIILQNSCISLRQRLSEIEASDQLLYHKPNETIFSPPLILVSQGVQERKLPKVAFCDFDTPIRFQHSLQSISTPKKDESLLLFLTCYLRSNLAQYFLFNTASNWGTEREKILFEELLRLPFPLPGSDFVHSEAKEIVQLVAKKMRSLKRKLEKGPKTHDLFETNEQHHRKEQLAWIKHQTDALQEEVEPLIYKYFDLVAQEITLIEDTVDVVLPSITPSSPLEQIPTLDSVENTKVATYHDGISVYAETLCKTLNAWAADMNSPFRVSATGGENREDGMAYITLSLDKKHSTFKHAPLDKTTSQALLPLTQSSSKKHGRLEYLKGTIVFEKEKMQIHIFKPSALIGWTRTAALNDASEIYARIAQARDNGGRV